MAPLFIQQDIDAHDGVLPGKEYSTKYLQTSYTLWGQVLDQKGIHSFVLHC